MNGIAELRSFIEKSSRIVFFGGAGVSTESGIPDFRSVDGLYNQKYKYPPETMLSFSFFIRHPEDFFAFYQDKVLHLNAKPNPAHEGLAKLEKAGKLRAVITQNIDGLHQAAGSHNVLELHGSVRRNYCMKCGRRYALSDIAEAPGVPRCACGGIIRPDVVLYEEALDQHVLALAEKHLREADLLIVGGTSLVVYPAAGLVDLCRCPMILINKGDTPRDSRASLVIRENIGAVMAQVSA